MASQRRLGSSFLRPSWTAVSSAPMETRTPEWCAAPMGSTIRPNRRLAYRNESRWIMPLGASTNSMCATSCHLSSSSPSTQTDEAAGKSVTREQPTADGRQPTPPEGRLVVPPSTTNVWPVTQEAASDARNRAAVAMSSGRPSRRNGIRAAMRSSPGPSHSAGRQLRLHQPWCQGIHPDVGSQFVGELPGDVAAASTPKSAAPDADDSL